MQANELRIGNLINVSNPAQCPFRIDGFEFLRQEDCKVEQHTEAMFGHPLTWYFKDLKPIPLTNHYFQNFGFTKDELGYWTKGDSIYSFVDRGDLGYMLVIADNEYKETYIKHVHRLQNLWFELTGEELQIK
ncbi:hypothetical protein KDU71_07540 [Carboxylicivirga sediminis]|uniref:Uncharacterized protein n=1 Tax=Carboxylicivirga sediminis TaxID=2006564 RepID=A0A941IXH9_9BACT|nr:hypothetical protein [Carboxylicivirga sediminis]MBR8535409.1 hypothetical protein [Carboxylicivirga sediminis]